MFVYRMRDEGVEYFEFYRKMIFFLLFIIFVDVDDEVEFDIKMFVVFGFERCLVNMLKNYLVYLNFIFDVLF